MDFGKAIDALKAGKRVARAGWNGKGMCLHLIGPWTYTDGRFDNFRNAPFIAIKAVDNTMVPWVASQTDMLAEDWTIVS